MNTRLPGIDAKIAFQNGRLFLYQSLCFDLVRVTGFEPAASCSQSRRATNCATPGYTEIGNTNIPTWHVSYYTQSTSVLSRKTDAFLAERKIGVGFLLTHSPKSGMIQSLCAAVVESADTRDLKSLAGNGVRVQVPPAAPCRSKLCIACSDFLQKSERAHVAAPPLRKKSRLLRLCSCKGGHDVSAALPNFCGMREGLNPF